MISFILWPAFDYMECIQLLTKVTLPTVEGSPNDHSATVSGVRCLLLKWGVLFHINQLMNRPAVTFTLPFGLKPWQQNHEASFRRIQSSVAHFVLLNATGSDGCVEAILNCECSDNGFLLFTTSGCKVQLSRLLSDPFQHFPCAKLFSILLCSPSVSLACNIILGWWPLIRFREYSKRSTKLTEQYNAPKILSNQRHNCM